MNNVDPPIRQYSELEIVRKAYAKQICAAAGTNDPCIISAFAQVPREVFLGSGPWSIFRGNKYVLTPDCDPIYVYTNDVVGLLPEKRVNNGQPSFHALLISAAKPIQGDHVIHIGAGTGYYTAILANLVGPTGQVVAIELDPQLAERAKSNLKPYENVHIHSGDGTKFRFVDANIIYINAGVTRPLSVWLDGLADGGRLILPLTTNLNYQQGVRLLSSQGAVFCIERRKDSYPARWISNVGIIPCEGARDQLSEDALAQALSTRKGINVAGLVRTGNLPAEQCWLRAPDWSLVYKEYWPVA